jgi:dephospho-CoA kinase
MKLVIGLVGRIGSGKTAVSEYLQDTYGAHEHRFSQILMDILDGINIPHERGHLQELGKILRARLGKDVIVNAFKTDLEKDTSEILIVDGIRYENEVAMLKEKDGVLLFVTASPEARYMRAVKRGEKGEAEITYEQFLESEKAETEKHIEEIKDSADYIIDNSGTLDELHDKVDGIVEALRK